MDNEPFQNARRGAGALVLKQEKLFRTLFCRLLSNSKKINKIVKQQYLLA